MQRVRHHEHALLSQLHSTRGSHVQGWFGRTDLTNMRSPIFVYFLNINREIQTKIRDGSWFSICFSVDFMLAKIKLWHFALLVVSRYYQK